MRKDNRLNLVGNDKNEQIIQNSAGRFFFLFMKHHLI